jgi:lysophosphatidic acid acyltransferase/lysophosphatidylinositol acyltransferase
LGWAWIFVETIFLKRDFEKDKPKIIADLTAIAEYPKEYPVTVGVVI